VPGVVEQNQSYLTVMGFWRDMAPEDSGLIVASCGVHHGMSI